MNKSIRRVRQEPEPESDVLDSANGFFDYETRTILNFRSAFSELILLDLEDRPKYYNKSYCDRSDYVE